MRKPAWLRGLEAGTSGGAVGAADWTSRLAWIFGLFVVAAGSFGLAALTDTVAGMLGGIILVLAFALAVSLSASGRLRSQLDRYEDRAFALAFDGNDPSCHNEHFVGPTGQNYLAVEVYRVRLVNTSARTIEGVTVSLERFAPQGAAFLPVALRLMGDDPNSGFPASRRGIALHPGSSRYFEVIALSYRPSAEVADLTLTYASQNPNMIDSGKRYELSVIAEGRDVGPTRAVYVAWIRSRRLYFCALEDEATHPQRVSLPG